MASSKLKHSSRETIVNRIVNRERRRAFWIRQKKTKDSEKRDVRFRRKREEEKNPKLREERLAKNVPMTIDKKRLWDEVGGDEEDALGLSVDVERLKRQKIELSGTEEAEAPHDQKAEAADNHQVDEDDVDSMLDPESDSDNAESGMPIQEGRSQKDTVNRQTSPPVSTATNLDLTAEFLATKFPTLFTPPPEPKILITTSINSTLHAQAELLTTLFPNSTYIRRTAHRYAHKYSVREIASFASNRSFTALLILNEDQKRPCGLDIVHLPKGPTFHFSISNWIEGKRLPGHGNPTNHKPELILNNFRTPLGLLTAHVFRSLFPPSPELRGRQVVTLHNQRDFIFVRRHRYVFRENKGSEKAVVGSDGKEMKAVEGLRAGLQELGPRFTLKLRRVDRGVQKSSGQEWVWKAGMEKQRTRFQL